VDDAANSPQSVALSGTGQDFGVSASTTSATVAAGQTASYTLSLASEGGFSGAVSLTCTGAPATATCSLTPSSVTLAAAGATPVTVTRDHDGALDGSVCRHLRDAGPQKRHSFAYAPKSLNLWRQNTETLPRII